MNETSGNTCPDGVIRQGATLATLAPSPFVVMACAVYLLGAASQFLTSLPVLARAGLWPFLLMQIVLVGAWYVLHARRLRDAGRGIAWAQGIVAIHILAIVLLVLVGAFFMESIAVEGWKPESFVLVSQLITLSRGKDLLTVLGLVACVALLVPLAFSIWAAMQPRRAA